MKKLLLATLLMAIHFGGNAQTLPLDIAAMRAVVAGDFACTTFHCRTKTIEAYEADTLYGLLYRTAASVASSGDLQTVTMLGNTTNLSIICTTPGFSAIMNAAGFQEENTSLSFVETFLGHYAGSPLLWLSNGTHINFIKSPTLTADYTNFLPDEGSGVSVDDMIGIHKSKHPYTVYLGSASSVLDYNNVLISDGVGNVGQFTATGFSVHDMTGNAFSASLSSGLPTLNFLNSGTSKISQIGFVPPTDNRQQYFADEGSSSNIPGSTVVIHLTKDSIRVGIASTDFSVVDKARQYHQNIAYQTGFAATSLYHQKLSTGFTTSITFIDPTANRNVIVPDEDGVFALLSDTLGGSGIGRLLTPTSQSNGVVFRDRKPAQTASVNLATYTVGGSDESLEVSANVLVTTATLHNFNVTCTYTDEGGTSRTLTMPFSSLAGAVITAIANAGGTVPSEGVPLHVRAKSGTTVIIGSTGTFTTVTYNIEGVIKKY